SRCATGGRPCSSTSLVLVRSGIVSAPPSGGRKARWSERRGVALLLLASIDPTGVRRPRIESHDALLAPVALLR
ncbi:hypothetical protein, partial [Mycobacteroides abscessus]|uniref:hypothetical protein n=1 Tax=Mycobacteroides abscessus TaxID=36809 RepID=UPI001A959425